MYCLLLWSRYEDVTATGPCAAPGFVDWSKAKCSHSSHCFPAVQASETGWALIWDQFDVVQQGIAAKRAVYCRERELSHTLHSNNISPPLFFSTSFTFVCWNKGRDASDRFYRHIRGGHSFPLLWLPQNSSFFQAKLCVCVFFFSGLIGELFGRKDSSGKHDFTCDRFISSPGIRPVALTSRGTEDRNRDFLEFFLEMMGLLSLDRSALLVMAALFGMNQFAEGGCSGRCCQGTDFTCVTSDWRMDRVYGMCYCDERCLKTKDCCFDYPTECPGMWCSNISADDWAFFFLVHIYQHIF